ncbi:MAG: ABC transporter permease [Lachnospiraceae bacterium]|nr:ABC transporter permease [Lachnospiraceae bacterium]
MNLFKIEMMKIRKSSYLWAVLGIYISLQAMGILFLFLGGDTPEEGDLFTEWNGLSALTTALTIACYSVFSAVAGARMIVDEYCGKNAVMLFTYPVRRKKILNVKCMIIMCITTGAAFVSNTAVLGVMYITAEIFGIMPRSSEVFLILQVLLSGFLSGIISFAIGIISAAVGWIKRSVMAAVICSLLIVCVIPNFIASMPEHTVLSILAAGICSALAAGGMYRFLSKGIEKMEV